MSTLRSLIAHARAALPELEVSVEQFQAYLLAHADLEALHQEGARDLLLACACARGEPKALQRFEAECLARLGTRMGSLRLNAQELDEIKQNLRQRLLVSSSGPPRITQYSGRSRLCSWVRVVAVREGLNHLRRKGPELLDEDAMLERVIAGPDPELEHLKRYYRSQFSAAFKAAMDALSAKERNLLRHCILDRMTCEQIGALHGVHTATASRWLTKLKVLLLSRTRKNLRRTLDVSPADLDSILRLIESRLDVSFSQLVA